MKTETFKKLRNFGVCMALACIIVGALVFSMPKATGKEKFEAYHYQQILEMLKADGFAFKLPTDNLTGKCAVIIHDVDFDPTGAETLSNIERGMGVRSCFYLRPDADYFTQYILYFQQLQAEGWMIGLHYDCLSRNNGSMVQATSLFKAQVTYLRSFFNITSTSYHGDSYNLQVGNYELYAQNIALWRGLNLTEVYSLTGYSYLRDTNFDLQIPSEVELGNLVLVQIHADWW